MVMSKVAQVEANTLEVDDVDLRHGDHGEGHLDQLHQAIDCGHHKRCLPMWHAVEAQFPPGCLKVQLQIPATATLISKSAKSQRWPTRNPVNMSVHPNQEGQETP